MTKFLAKGIYYGQLAAVANIADAWAAGKRVEYYDDSSAWVELNRYIDLDLLLSAPNRYRIKPEPKTYYAARCTHTGAISAALDTFQEADNHGCELFDSYEVVQLNEVPRE